MADGYEKDDYERQLPKDFLDQIKKEMSQDGDNKTNLNLKVLIAQIKSKIEHGEPVDASVLKGLDYLIAMAENPIFDDEFSLEDQQWQEPENMAMLYEIYNYVQNMSDGKYNDVKNKIKNKNFLKLIEAIMSNQLQLSQKSHVARAQAEVQKKQSKNEHGRGQMH